VIIGRHQLPTDALESQAAALWWDNAEELVLTGKPLIEWRGIRGSDPDILLGVKVAVCADWRTELLQQLQREAESTQAIDRLRLIHNIETKHCILLSSVPLDLTVDRLVSLSQLAKGSKIEQALALAPKGVLPINPTFLKESFPELFPSIKSANKALEIAGLSGAVTSSLLHAKKQVTLGGHHYNLISFSVAGRQGPPIKALAPVDMRIFIVERQLARQFGKIEVKESTLPYRGLGSLRPNLNDDDEIAIRYEQLPKHYSRLYNAYYVIVE